MRNTILFFILLFTFAGANAIEIEIKQDTTKNRDYKLWFMGRIDLYAYMDSQRGISVCEGLQYITPASPVINDQGIYVNELGEGTLNFNIAASRFGIGGSMNLSNSSSIMGYVEADFLAQTSSSTLAFRLRHAYAKYTKGQSSFLFGQTTHLALNEALASPTVTFGSGYPFSVLARPVQFRYSYDFEGSSVGIDAAASIFWGAEFDYQTSSKTPEFALRLRVGNPKASGLSLTAGIKTLDLSLGVSPETSKMTSHYLGFMGKLMLFDGYSLRGGTLYGGDLSTLGTMGGVAMKEDKIGYTPLWSLASYLDFSTKRYGGIEFGIFAGYQKNLGTTAPISEVIYRTRSSYIDVDSQWRIAPRVWYHIDGLCFGLEYMYAESAWMKGTNEYYRPMGELLTGHNHRITLLARFVF